MHSCRVSIAKVIVVGGDSVSRGSIPDGYELLSVDDREFFAFCECCGVALCDGDEHFCSEDGYVICPACYAELIEEGRNA